MSHAYQCSRHIWTMSSKMYFLFSPEAVRHLSCVKRNCLELQVVPKVNISYLFLCKLQQLSPPHYKVLLHHENMITLHFV